jgi:ferrous iron transport protein B
VVDSVHLDRDLFLTKQLIDMGKSMVVALNMMDEVQKNGIIINVRKLEELLGVPVIPTAAAKKRGMDELFNAIGYARQGNRAPTLEDRIREMAGKTYSEEAALMILEDDEIIAERYGMKTAGLRDQIYLERRQSVEDMVNKVLMENNKGAAFGVQLGRWMLKPVTGIPLLAVTLYIMYKIIGIFVAGNVVGFTEDTGDSRRAVFRPRRQGEGRDHRRASRIGRQRSHDPGAHHP